MALARMAITPSLHPRASLRRGRGGSDLLVVERASELIGELGADLDRQLAGEQRSTEQLRLLREATNRITRSANDAIQAYRRARRSLDAELERGGPRAEASAEMRECLLVARSELLDTLAAAGRRYPASAALDLPNLGADR